MKLSYRRYRGWDTSLIAIGAAVILAGLHNLSSYPLERPARKAARAEYVAERTESAAAPNVYWHEGPWSRKMSMQFEEGPGNKPILVVTPMGELRGVTDSVEMWVERPDLVDEEGNILSVLIEKYAQPFDGNSSEARFEVPEFSLDDEITVGVKDPGGLWLASYKGHGIIKTDSWKNVQAAPKAPPKLLPLPPRGAKLVMRGAHSKR